MSDEQFYARVVAELKASGPIPGLWAKAFAESNGNEVTARALYLRLRVAQLQAVEEVARRNYASEQMDSKPEPNVSESFSFSKSAYPIFLTLIAVMLLAAVVGHLTR